MGRTHLSLLEPSPCTAASGNDGGPGVSHWARCKPRVLLQLGGHSGTLLTLSPQHYLEPLSPKIALFWLATFPSFRPAQHPSEPWSLMPAVPSLLPSPLVLPMTGSFSGLRSQLQCHFWDVSGHFLPDICLPGLGDVTQPFL